MASADRPEQPSTTTPTFETCGARTRRGTACRRPAGHGTEHPGFGNCKLHFGATPNGGVHAARLEAAALGEEHDMAPHDALLWCVRIAAGEVRYFTQKVEQLEAAKVVVDDMRIRRHEGDASSFVERTSHADLNIWIRARQDAVDRLARYAKVAVDAGVQERAVRIAEQFVGDVAAAIDVILTAFGLREDPRAPEVVRTALVALEGGKARGIAA